MTSLLERAKARFSKAKDAVRGVDHHRKFPRSMWRVTRGAKVHAGTKWQRCFQGRELRPGLTLRKFLARSRAVPLSLVAVDHVVMMSDRRYAVLSNGQYRRLTEGASL